MHSDIKPNNHSPIDDASRGKDTIDHQRYVINLITFVMGTLT